METPAGVMLIHPSDVIFEMGEPFGGPYLDGAASAVDDAIGYGVATKGGDGYIGWVVGLNVDGCQVEDVGSEHGYCLVAERWITLFKLFHQSPSGLYGVPHFDNIIRRRGMLVSSSLPRKVIVLSRLFRCSNLLHQLSMLLPKGLLGFTLKLDADVFPFVLSMFLYGFSQQQNLIRIDYPALSRTPRNFLRLIVVVDKVVAIILRDYVFNQRRKNERSKGSRKSKHIYGTFPGSR